MIYKVNVTLLRQFLVLYCPSKPNIILTNDQYQYYLGSFLAKSISFSSVHDQYGKFTLLDSFYACIVLPSLNLI